MSIERKFFTTFQGLSSSYVKNELPKETERNGNKIKTNITTVRENVDAELFARHLNGDFAIGICPVMNNGLCNYGVIDIDCYDVKRLLRVLKIIHDYSFPFIPFRSKSGGLHLYLFFSDAEKSQDVVKCLQTFCEVFSLQTIFGVGKVEVFPKQTKIKDGNCGSSVTVPYFNMYNKTYTPMVDCTLGELSADDFFRTLKDGGKTTTDAFMSCFARLPYNDAPPCLQQLLLTEQIGSESSGRDNFLYSMSVYLQMKMGENFKDALEEVNKSFASPLPQTDVDRIYSSVSGNKSLYYKCKDIPCSDFCNKKVCRSREFGIGKDKGCFSSIEYGNLKRILSADPYYIWELRLIGTDKWKQVEFKDETVLLDQKAFAKMCVRYLNFAPNRVKDEVWNDTLNSVLQHIEEVTIDESTDTSETQTFKRMFIKYLTTRIARYGFQINLGNVCKKDDKYFFTTDGLEDYMKQKKIVLHELTLREMLLRLNAKADVFTYAMRNGVIQKLPCWSVCEDENLKDEENKQNLLEEACKEALDRSDEILSMEVEKINKGDLADEISF